MSVVLIEKILSESSPQKLLTYLKKQTADSLATTPGHEPLDLVNPAEHSLGYLFILKARLAKVTKKDAFAKLLPRIVVFLQTFNVEQIRVGSAEFHDFLTDFSDRCNKVLQSSYVALDPLKAAVERYAQSPSHLTSVHYIFIERCLLSRCYDEALPVLDTPIYDLDLETGLQTIHYLQYFYYGCLVYIGLKDYQKAIDFAKFVMTAPAAAASAIQDEACKFFVLLSVILTGELAPIPKTVSQACVHSFKHLCHAYTELARSFKSPEAFDTCLQTHRETFEQDKTLGLIQIAWDHVEKARIIALKETYVAISLEDVARKVYGRKSEEPLTDFVPHVEKLILEMIDDGQLTAKISGSPPIITFMDNPAKPDRHRLDAVISSVSTINAKLKDFDNQVGLSKIYIAKSGTGTMTKPNNQGRVSPVDGESDIRWKMRDGGEGSGGGWSRPRGGVAKSSSSKSSGNSFDGTRFLSMNDKMED